MPEKAEALSILFVLLPGFVSAYVTQHLAVRRDQSQIEKIVEALIFSFLLYLITLPFFGYTLPLRWAYAADGTVRVFAHFSQLVALFVVSLILGVLYAASINHDWLLTLMRRFRVTERTARISIWNDTFQEIGGWAQIGFKDGRQLFGWIRYYSDDASECSIFLERASWIDGGEAYRIDGPGILITSNAELETVAFLGADQGGLSDVVSKSAQV